MLTKRSIVWLAKTVGIHFQGKNIIFVTTFQATKLSTEIEIKKKQPITKSPPLKNA